MAPQKKRNVAAAVVGVPHHCVVGVPKTCASAKTVLLVPSDQANRVHKALQKSSESIYSTWSLDTTELDDVTEFPTCLGHVVPSSRIPQNDDGFPTEEHKILQLLIDGKVSKNQYLVVETRDGKRDYDDTVFTVVFESDDEEMIQEMVDILGEIYPDGDSYYVGEVSIVGTEFHPSLNECDRFMRLTKEDVSDAKANVGHTFGCDVHGYLRRLREYY